MSISKLLNKKNNKILFTTPSHNQNAFFTKKLSDFYHFDYSEIEGYDNLSSPNGDILVSQGKASQLMKSKQTFYVVQGATTAILAAMKTLISPGDKILAARNCHKSVFSGLLLTGAQVGWFMPEIDEDWGIYTQINSKKLEQTLELDDYKVFIMTSPTYEGVNSNINEIAKICKSHNVYLIVDEAHGALYNFSDKLPQSAIEQGADVSINSLHKTAGALNQTALLNISCDIRNTEIGDFQKALNLFQTTSPSYPLLANIEACLEFLSSKNGKNEIDNLILNIEKFKNYLKQNGIEFYENEFHDPTKILLRKKGISGIDLSNKMYDEFDIEDEMNNNIFCLYLTGIGTTKSKLDKLKSSLLKVKVNSSYEFEKPDFQPHPITRIQPIDTFKQKYKFVNKDDAILKISNKMILPYPPGIALLYPGEAIQEWHLKYLDDDVEVMDL